MTQHYKLAAAICNLRIQSGLQKIVTRYWSIELSKLNSQKALICGLVFLSPLSNLLGRHDHFHCYEANTTLSNFCLTCNKPNSKAKEESSVLMVIFTWPKHSKYTPSKIIKLLFKVFISWCIEGLSQRNCEIQKQIVAKSCMRFCFF